MIKTPEHIVDGNATSIYNQKSNNKIYDRDIDEIKKLNWKNNSALLLKL